MNAPAPTEQQNEILLLVVCGEQPRAVRAETMLRNNGWAARHIWVCDAGETEDALTRTEPDLVLCSADLPLAEICDLARQLSPHLPVLALNADDSAAPSSEQRAHCLAEGAEDLVSLADGPDADHYAHACARALRNSRTAYSLRRAQMRIAEFVARQRTLVRETTRGLLTLSDGIIVEANPAVARMLGHDSADALQQQLLLDFAAPDSVDELRQQLALLHKGKANSVEFVAQLRGEDAQRVITADIKLSRRESGDEILVDALLIPQTETASPAADDPDDAAAPETVPDAAETHPDYGTLCVQALQSVARAIESGSNHGLIYALIDGYDDHQARIGLTHAAHIADTWEGLIADALPARADVYRPSCDELCVVLPCADAEEIESLSAELCQRVRQQRFSTNRFDCQITTSIAVYPINEGIEADPEDILKDGCSEARDLSRSGGDNVRSIGPAARAAAEEREARKKAEFIRQSLEKSKRFHLAFQRISCLGDDQRDMYDVLVRLTDPQGNEWHARDFLPIAQRFGLMPAIDRWVFDTALQMLAKRRDAAVALMLRLSEESLADSKDLLQRLGEAAPKAGAVAVQVRESVAQRHLRTVTALRKSLHELKVGFVLDYFGETPAGAPLVEQIAPDYVKFAPNFAGDFQKRDVHARLQKLIKSARSQKSRIIIPFVEDTRVMGELWQMGINYVQGYGLQEAEAVMLAGSR